MAQDYQNVRDVITQEAQADGIPAYIPLTIALHESGFNPQAVGDHGTSFGLFQLHQGGLLPSGMDAQAAEDPIINAHVAVPHMVSAYRQGVSQGLTGFDLVAYTANNSGWPGNKGVSWTTSHTGYDQGLLTSYNNLGHYGDTGAVIPETGGGGNTAQSDGFIAQISSMEKMQTFSDWKADNPDVSNLQAPFEYVFSEFKGFGFRALIVLVGLVLLIFALIEMLPTKALAEAATKGAVE